MERAPGGARQREGDPETGAQLFQQKPCAACHAIDGGSRSGPALNGLYGRTVQLTDGTTITADEAYIRESILDPAAKVVMGYNPMPPIGVTEDEANHLVAFIMTLE